MMRHLRFRMRTLFVLITLSAVCYALSVSQAQRQRAAVAEISRLGGYVLYESSAYDTDPLRIVPWLAHALGRDWFHEVDGVHLPGATDEALAVLGALPKLRKLTLPNPIVTRSGMAHVALLSELDSLQIERGTLDDKCIESLRSLRQLRHLEVRSTALTDASLVVISQLPAIKSVFLAECNISDRGVETLRNSTTIVWLGLSGAKLTEASAAVFSGMPNLEELHLEQMSVSDEAAPKLTSLGCLKTFTRRQPQVPLADMAILESPRAAMGAGARPLGIPTQGTRVPLDGR